MLRCRYCAHYVGIQFMRVVLPSGAVMINESVREVHAADIGAEVTPGARMTTLCDNCKERIDYQDHFTVSTDSLPHSEGEPETR